ncbi:4-hydroxybenzoate octaprenyltransferase [Marinobacterium nitratireducens]|uniref:4-hydroxybenzoate octaprenyltransferase n=1 Tax=Marinobacterium nitratireducens TaxID=518897 RepID=A0A917Z9Y8_9GAMM|nr:4-hydroxybenzoate octaprenyltransferase [Marinobacterium nitratireducens]GGO77245.1 4-hydroxybenzoate octaprenyltransferase [Marinobacterium nitratireducens]
MQMQPTSGFLRDRFDAYVQLSRVNRPIGIYLLLWPTLWALWIAAEGLPPLDILFIFCAGVALTRAGGCVINDFADRNVDGHVKRTAARPLPSGRVSAREALYLFAVLMLLAFILVLYTNTTTVLMSFGGLALASTYPFMKRYTHLPQVVLGAAFSWAIPMAFTALDAKLVPIAWLLFTANLLWTVAYDTYYAMVDRDDDLVVGIKSTAILFGDADRFMIGLLQALALLCLVLVARQLGLSIWFYAGLLVASGFFVYQSWITRFRERDPCFRAFLNNHYAGLAIFLGLVAHYALDA